MNISGLIRQLQVTFKWTMSAISSNTLKSQQLHFHKWKPENNSLLFKSHYTFSALRLNHIISQSLAADVKDGSALSLQTN